MLGVDARQGAPKDGDSPIELFQVIEAIFYFYFSTAMPRIYENLEHGLMTWMKK